MKKMLLLGACLLALGFAPAKAQTGGPGVVVVSMLQLNTTFKAAITREDGKSELLTFPSGVSDKNLVAGAQAYQKLIAQFYREGYLLKSTFGGDGRTVLIFVKGQ